MSKHNTDSGLSKLINLSKTVLNDRELVELVIESVEAEKSPTVIHKLVQERGYSVRQAKSAKSFAVIGRDFGANKMREILSQYERKEKMKDILKDIKNPVAKFKVMVKEGITDGILDVVQNAIKNYQVGFYMQTKFDSCILLGDILSYGEGEKRFCIFIGCDGQGAWFDVRGLQKLTNCDDEKLSDLISDAIQRFNIEEPRLNFNFNLLNAIEMATEYVLDPDLQNKIRIWILRSRIQDFESMLGVAVRARRVQGIDENSISSSDGFQPIIDQFLELGWDMSMIRQEMLDLIKVKKEELIRYVPFFSSYFIHMRCFSYEDKREGELADIILHDIMPAEWNSIIDNFNPQNLFHYKEIAKWPRGRKEFHRQKLIELLVRGRLQIAWQLMLNLGVDVVREEFDNWREIRPEDHKEYLHELLAEAFYMLCQKENFGLATAILKNFGYEVVSSEKFIEDHARSLAEKDLFEQKEALDRLELETDIDDDDAYEILGKKGDEYHQKFRSVFECKKQEVFDFLKKAIESAEKMAIALNQSTNFVDILDYIHIQK